jgi:hypothetical protein
MQLRYESAPFPHLLVAELVPTGDYAALRFPDELLASETDWGLTASDDNYAVVLQDPAWRALHDRLRGVSFVTEVLHRLSADIRRAGCLVDPDRVSLTPFVETREQKQMRALDTSADPNEVYTRLDFQSKAAGGYRDFVHLDWPRRIVGGILFFSDADEEGLEGGELGLYRDRGFRNDRWCHDPELIRCFPPRHNTGVIFLNSNVGFHGPRAITKLEGRRRWLYFTISSRVDIWPSAA